MANAGQRTSNPKSIPLTPYGWDQAATIATSFVHTPTLIVTSDYLRAQQTSLAMQARWPEVPCVEWPVHEFTYLSPFHCENMTAAQRQPLVQAYWQRWDPAYVDGPGSESFMNLVTRAKAMLQQAQQQQQGTLVMFTHGQFMQMVLWLIHNPSGHWSSHTMKLWRRAMLAEPIHNGQIIQLTYSSSAGWIQY
jgi:2,3-bisphosphoglycerate-dependent phosphoglycerate mutase